MTGPAGMIECAIDAPPVEAERGVAVVCHPNPLQGGTMDNKVAQTLARTFMQLGYRAVRFNYRGVGASQGSWDEGRGEVEDALAVIREFRDPAKPLVLGGFSFGGYVASQAARSLPDDARLEQLVLVAPAVDRCEVGTVPSDTLVFHGELDEVVPLSAALDWARPQTLPVTVLPGVGHFFHGQLLLLRNLILRSWPR